MDYKGDLYYIAEVLKGNQNAFRHIVEKHKDHAFNLALRICGNREEAEEVAQDAFIKAYNSLGRFKMKSTFATWLYRIVYNTSISLVRLRKKAPLSLDDFPAEAAEFAYFNSSEEAADTEYRNAIVNFALQKLNEEERGLIGLYYYEELTTEEIEAITGINKSNIKVRLFRARQKMLETIQKVEKKNSVHHEQVI